MNTLPFFFDLSEDQIKEALKSFGEPVYRAGQLWEGFYKKLSTYPVEITSISKKLRDQLSGAFSFNHLSVVTRLVSKDQNTVKILFKLPNGNAVESVLMRYENRNTLCISSQSGCAMGCVFCATGQMGFRQNLSSGEIIEQVLYFARELAQGGHVVTNIVMMGMGEPFLNYDAVLAAIERLNDPKGFNQGARRFTISTVGVIPGITQFTREKNQVNLAISLHAANDELRSSLLPIGKKYPLVDLIAACKSYVELTHRRITFEWALIQGVNDSTQDADELVNLVKGLLCHVNIIQLNPTQKYSGKTTTHERALAFQAVLQAKGIPCTIRLRRGIEINAGCGQLASTINE
jgi:23S rRNA (adenine2503-C2)-methyltransferase